jgi:hypothetical protein
VTLSIAGLPCFTGRLDFGRLSSRRLVLLFEQPESRPNHLACCPEATGGDLVCHEATELLGQRDVQRVIARHADCLGPGMSKIDTGEIPRRAIGSRDVNLCWPQCLIVDTGDNAHSPIPSSPLVWSISA